MDRKTPDGTHRDAEARGEGGVDERGDEPSTPRDEDREQRSSDTGDLVVIVTVTRSGGIAGLRRGWRAEAAEEDASPWIELIDGCPWDAAQLGRHVEGADRFMWSVDARCGPEERQAELADSDVEGPWRQLIDAVREAGSPVPRERH